MQNNLTNSSYLQIPTMSLILSHKHTAFVQL